MTNPNLITQWWLLSFVFVRTPYGNGVKEGDPPLVFDSFLRLGKQTGDQVLPMSTNR